MIADDDPVTCAAYTKQHDLLALERWQSFKNLTKKDKILARAIKQSKLRQIRRAQTYMFRYLIPRKKTSNWYDAIKLEMESMQAYKAFKKVG